MAASIRWALPLLAALLPSCAVDGPTPDALPPGTGGSIGAMPPGPCVEGTLRACHVDLPTQGSVVNCFYGVEACVGGTWSSCAIPGGLPEGLPAPAPCDEGATRSCYARLPDQGPIINCYYGHETCAGGVWGPCDDGAITPVAGATKGEDESAGPGVKPQSLSAPIACVNDPCNPSCQVFREIPLLGVNLPGKAIPPWDSGSFASISNLPGFAAKAQRLPCGSASDCQVNQLCTLPITSASVHDKCAPGPALSPTSGADACVDAICALHPTCCTVPSGTCAHDRCTTGAPLTAACDLCVGAVCAVRPSCCAVGGAWDATCVAEVEKTCGLACNRWDDSCVAQVHDTCGAFCTALPALGPPAQCAHDKCYTGDPIAAACADPCVAEICSSAAYASCCTTAWDASCVAAVNSVCGQSCPLKGQCSFWLGAETDPFCPDKPDLTLGIPCNTRIPVCNVGEVPASAPIQVVSAPAGTLRMPSCTPHPSALACPPLLEDIAPGQCVDLNCPGLATGFGEELMVNANGAVTECLSTPGDASCNAANTNNWTLSGGSTLCEPPICTGSQQPAQVKAPNFHFLVERSGASAAPAGKWPAITSGLGNFIAAPAVAGSKVAVQFFPDAPPSIPASCTAAACLVGTSAASPYGPTGNCTLRTLPNGFGLQLLPSAVLAANVKAVAVGAGLAPTPMAYAGAVNITKAYGGDRNIVLILTSDITTCNAVTFTSVNSLAGQASEALVNSKIKTWVITVGMVSALFDPIARSGGTGAAIAVPTGDDVALTQALTTIKTNYYACSWPLPSPALFDKQNPKVELKNAFGTVVSTFSQVPNAESCTPASSAHFHYDDNQSPTKIILCPATCTVARANIGYAVKLTLACPGTYSDSEYTQIYQGVCPLGSRVSWGFLTYDTTEPPSTSTLFRVRTADTEDQLAKAPLHDLRRAETGPPDTQKCLIAGPAPCPLDLFDALGGPPSSQYEYLELVLDMHTNVSHSKTPTIHGWEITYSCPPSE